MNQLAQVLFKNAFVQHFGDMFNQATEGFPKTVKISIVMILTLIIAASIILAIGISMHEAPDISIG